MLGIIAAATVCLSGGTIPDAPQVAPLLQLPNDIPTPEQMRRMVDPIIANYQTNLVKMRRLRAIIEARNDPNRKELIAQLKQMEIELVQDMVRFQNQFR